MNRRSFFARLGKAALAAVATTLLRATSFRLPLAVEVRKDWDALYETAAARLLRQDELCELLFEPNPLLYILGKRRA